METTEQKIEKAIRETLVIENPQSINIAVEKIIKALPPPPVSDEEIRLEAEKLYSCFNIKGFEWHFQDRVKNFIDGGKYALSLLNNKRRNEN